MVIVRGIFSVYALIIFVTLLLILLPVFFIVSFWGKIKGGNVLYKVCGIWADIWLFMLGIRVKQIHEAPKKEQRPCIFVANHISYMDIPMMMKVIREPVRILGKYEMSKVPLFGFVYKTVVVMVNRNHAGNRAKSVKVLKNVLKQGISIFIFPEGTFNTTGQPIKELYDGAFRIAIETQTPIQPVLFPDTVKRMHYNNAFSITPGICRAVFTEMISVEGCTLKDLQHLKETVKQRMEDCLIKYES